MLGSFAFPLKISKRLIAVSLERVKQRSHWEAIFIYVLKTIDLKSVEPK